jgi:hypothetical protein
MKYPAEKGSDVMIYTPDFIKTGSGIRKSMEGYKDTDSVVIS